MRLNFHSCWVLFALDLKPSHTYVTQDSSTEERRPQGSAHQVVWQKVGVQNDRKGKIGKQAVQFQVAPAARVLRLRLAQANEEILDVGGVNPPPPVTTRTKKPDLGICKQLAIQVNVACLVAVSGNSMHA